MVDTIFHEFEHFYNNCIIQAPITDKYAINLAKQDILIYSKYGQVYKQNYWNMSDEIDARLTAYDKTMEVLEDITDSERGYLRDLYQRNRNSDLDKTLENASLFREGKEGLDQDKDSFFTTRVDEFIQAHPEVLEIYRSLLIEYNRDGKKKSNIQLIKQLKKHLTDIRNDNKLSQQEKKIEKERVRNTYFDILAERLQDMTREEAIEFEKACGIEGKNGTKTFYDLMKEHYIETYNKKIEDIDKLQEIMQGKKAAVGVTGNFEAKRKIIEQKYGRLLQTVSNLRESVYRTETQAINGVDLGYVAPIELSSDKQQYRNKVVTKFIDTYDKLENDQDFKKRENLEDKNISQVLNAVELQRCSSGFMKNFELGNNKTFSEDQFKIMMRALKAADALTVEGGRDYLSDLINVPFINDTLLKMSKDENIKDMVRKANKITDSDIKRTVADKDKIIANEHLKSSNLKNENAQEEFKCYSRHTSNAYIVRGKSDWERKKLAMWRISSRQQGFKIGKLSEQDECGIRRLSLKGNSSCLINLEDLGKFAKSKNVVECVVNGKKYQAIGFKANEEQEQ